MNKYSYFLLKRKEGWLQCLHIDVRQGAKNLKVAFINENFMTKKLLKLSL